MEYKGLFWLFFLFIVGLGSRSLAGIILKEDWKMETSSTASEVKTTIFQILSIIIFTVGLYYIH
jgi:hypothetical protein